MNILLQISKMESFVTITNYFKALDLKFLRGSWVRLSFHYNASNKPVDSRDWNWKYRRCSCDTQDSQMTRGIIKVVKVYISSYDISSAKATSMTRVKWNFCNNLDFNNRRQGQFPPGYGKKWVETKINTVYRITSPFASKQEIEQ